MLLFEIGRLYEAQFYLDIMYKTMFSLAYYGLLRMGEVAMSPHVLEARNVCIGSNRNKILLTLYSSKMHSKNSKPQHIKLYLFEEIHRLIASYKDKLPSKSKEDYFPHILWIVPLQHKYFNNNEHRSLFADTMEAAVQKYTNMCALRLKKLWEEREGSLFLQEQLRYTQEGNICYWRATDLAIKFWDKKLSEIMIKCQKKNPLSDITCHPKSNFMKNVPSRDGNNAIQHHHHNNNSHARCPSFDSQYSWHS